MSIMASEIFSSNLIHKIRNDSPFTFFLIILLLTKNPHVSKYKTQIENK